MPAEGVKAADLEDAEEFEQGFASATRTDELRAAGQLNLESPWMQAVDDEGMFYWRIGTREIVSEPPEEGTQGDAGRLRREDVLIEWDGDKHGEGTAVMIKIDKRRGACVSVDDDWIAIRFDRTEEWIHSSDVCIRPTAYA
eukprot:COSAG04_NODE_4614_length_1989_cov_1.038624_2_plen_141_part_00